MPRDFNDDISEALHRYHSLHLVNGADDVQIEGKIIFSKSNHGFDDTFDVSIRFPANYPFRFPVVEEVGKRIPKVKERHINGNGYLCFAAEPEEILICKRGISLTFFIQKILTPHLAREVYVEINKCYPHGERPHGYRSGNMDFYFEKLRTFDSVLVLKSLCYISSNRMPESEEPCICGSGLIFKHCHHDAIHELALLPERYIKNEVNSIYKIINR